MAPTRHISPDDLRRVSSARWLIPILAVMHRENGSRFGSLIRGLDMSRSVLSRQLDLLETFGWIARTSGHGHPLRPEYFLTADGLAIAAWSEDVTRQRALLGLEQHDFGRWSLPIMVELRDGWKRFSELQRGLTPITPRALSLTLGQMLDIDLVRHRAAMPPQLYGLTDRGHNFAAPLLLPIESTRARG